MWKACNESELSYDDKKKLDNALDDWGLYGGLGSFDAWRVWRRSDYKVLPFAGGWFDQPKWIRFDFETLDLVRMWHEENAKRPDVAHLQNPMDTEWQIEM